MLFTVGCSGENGANTTNNENQNEVAETETEAQTEAPNPVETLGLDYTTGLDDKGYFSGVNAGEYIELPDYKNLAIPSEVHTVTEEYLQGSIDGLLSSYATTKQVTDRPIEDGDTVNIDYVGSVDGVEFEGGSTGGAGTDVTIGVTSYIDDFLAQLIGHTPGESFDIEVTFPDDYGVENLNGKDAVFAITVNHISEPEVPELTDEFVSTNLASMYQTNTVEELKNYITTTLQENAIKGFIQNHLVTTMVVNSMPEEVTSYQERMMENYYKISADSYGVTVEEFLKSSVGHETMEDAIAAASEQITQMSNFSLVIQGIAQDAGIEVTEEDLKEYFLEYTGNEDYSNFTNIYGLPYIKNSLLQEVVFNYIADNAVLE